MPSEKHILLLIGGHFANAPRPQKEAQAARELGFRVSVRGMWHDDKLAEEDRKIADQLDIDFAPLLDLRMTNAAAYLARIRGKLARHWLRLTGKALPSTFGITAPLMLREAKRLKPDLVMIHSEAGLWTGKKLIQQGFRVGVDFEDWFSEDLPATSRSGRPVKQLKQLEHSLLHHAHATCTTTRSLARELAAEAKCENLPLLIPNAFPPLTQTHESLSKRQTPDKPIRLYWFSQTIGPGRGLELLAEALPSLKGNWELHLRGNLQGYRPWFESTFADIDAEKITLHAPVPNEELPYASSPFDIGLALEIPDCLNRDLTASNKIFEYLRCGLAIVATRTQGQAEVINACPDAGQLVSPHQSEEICQALQTYLDHPGKLANAQTAARLASETVWSWEKFSPDLKNLLIEAIS